MSQNTGDGLPVKIYAACVPHEHGHVWDGEERPQPQSHWVHSQPLDPQLNQQQQGLQVQMTQVMQLLRQQLQHQHQHPQPQPHPQNQQPQNPQLDPQLQSQLRALQQQVVQQRTSLANMEAALAARPAGGAATAAGTAAQALPPQTAGVGAAPQPAEVGWTWEQVEKRFFKDEGGEPTKMVWTGGDGWEVLNEIRGRTITTTADFRGRQWHGVCLQGMTFAGGVDAMEAIFTGETTTFSVRATPPAVCCAAADALARAARPLLLLATRALSWGRRAQTMPCGGRAQRQGHGCPCLADGRRLIPQRPPLAANRARWPLTARHYTLGSPHAPCVRTHTRAAMHVQGRHDVLRGAWAYSFLPVAPSGSRRAVCRRTCA